MRLDEEDVERRVTALNRQVVDVETTLTSLRERERETGSRVASLHKQERETGNRVASLHKQERETGNRVASLHKQERELEGTVGALQAETARLEGTAQRYCGCVHVLVIHSNSYGYLYKETLQISKTVANFVSTVLLCSVHYCLQLPYSYIYSLSVK